MILASGSDMRLRPSLRCEWPRRSGAGGIRGGAATAQGWSVTSTTADIPTLTRVMVTGHHLSSVTSLGSHPAPPVEHNLLLTPRSDWSIAFGDNITYQCEVGMFFETQEVDPTLKEVIVPCIETIGEINSPKRAQCFLLVFPPHFLIR